MTQLRIETFPIGPIQTNCYLVWPENESVCWVIDPGGLPGGVIDRIEQEKLTPELLVITHGHWDHFIGNRCLKDKYPSLRIAIHEEDAGALPNERANMSLSFIGKSIVSPPADELLTDGQILKLGSVAFQVIHTPGHSPGGICLYTSDPTPPVAFVGDLIFAEGGVGRTDLPKSSTSQLYDSLKKVFKLMADNTIIYSGHGPSTILGRERLYLKNILES